MKYVFRKRGYRLGAALFDAVGGLLFWPFRKRKLAPISPKSILVVRLDHLGDVLLATGVPKAVKESFPEARLLFLTSSWAAPFFENNPFVDEVLIYDARWFWKNRYRSQAKTVSYGGLARQLRKRGIDVGLSLRGDLRENLLLFLAGIRRRIGYGITGGGFLLTKELRYRRNAHETEHTREILNFLGIRVEAIRPALYFSAEENERFEKKRLEWGLTDDRQWVGFQWEAGSPAKEWPAGNSRDFLSGFAARFPGYGLVFFGRDVKKMHELSLPAEVKYLDLTGKTSLRELCLAARKLCLFVGPDSGPAHIAAAMGVPVVFLYSGTNQFQRWRPLSESSSVLKRPVPCSPCELEVCVVEGHPCMSGITAAGVLEAVESKLKTV